jgi:hypothetical protein
MASELTQTTKPSLLDDTRNNEVPWSRELVEQIAKDVGAAVAHHISIMYPAAVAATPSTFLTSVRNCVRNEIMAAVAVSDADQIEARLKDRKAHRRRISTMNSKFRDKGPTSTG